MKNRKSLIILIPLTCIVWGLILWKVLQYKVDDKHTILRTTSIDVEEKNDSISYSLKLNYKDPFLRSTYFFLDQLKSPKRIGGAKSVKLNTVKNVEKKPELAYYGVIKHSDEKTALIKISHTNFLLQEGDTVEEIQIKSIFRDSIIVSHSNKVYSYVRQ